MAQNAGHIAQPCRRGQSLRKLCGDSDRSAVFGLNHLEPAFFPHPCAETPTRAETLTRAETHILTLCGEQVLGKIRRMVVTHV